MDPAEFDAMLNEMGQAAEWRPSYDCPCRAEYSGAADPDCPVCNGKGVTWGDAVTGTVAVAGQKVQQAWAKLGMYEQGDMVLTLPTDSPVFAMGQFDRVTMMDSTVPFSRVLTHTGGELLQVRVSGITRVFWRAAGDIVVGALPTVGSDGALAWPAPDPDDPDAPGEPPEGVQYSITGRRHPEYFALKEFPQDRAHFGGTLFPRRVALREMDLFSR